MQRPVSLHRSAILLALVSTLVVPLAARAQPPGDTVQPLPPEVEGFTLTPFVAASFGADLESAPATFGAALGYGANQRITLEAEFGIAPDAQQGDLIEVDSSFWTLSGNVLYHFVRENFTPYVTAGLGVVSSDPDLPVILDEELEEDTTGFGINFGAGLKAALNQRFGLRADLRYFNATNAAPDHWRLYGGLVIRRLGR